MHTLKTKYIAHAMYHLELFLFSFFFSRVSPWRYYFSRRCRRCLLRFYRYRHDDCHFFCTSFVSIVNIKFQFDWIAASDISHHIPRESHARTRKYVYSINGRAIKNVNYWNQKIHEYSKSRETHIHHTERQSPIFDRISRGERTCWWN